MHINDEINEIQDFYEVDYKDTFAFTNLKIIKTAKTNQKCHYSLSHIFTGKGSCQKGISLTQCQAAVVCVWKEFCIFLEAIMLEEILIW